MNQPATKPPKSTKLIKEIKAIIEAEGGKKIVCRGTGGSHYIFIFEREGGEECRLITARTPSDHRNSKNIRAEVRRLMKGTPT